jgi:hypothetical protein
MDLEFLSRVFSTWKGLCFTYEGDFPDGVDHITHITKRLSQALGTNDFISRVARIDGVYYVYLEDTASYLEAVPEFSLIGEINGQSQGAE